MACLPIRTPKSPKTAIAVKMCSGLSLFVTVVTALFSSTTPDLRPWSVADSIALQQIVELNGESNGPAVFSPDGEYAFLIVRRDFLAADLVRYQLMVFAASEIRSRLAARSYGSTVLNPIAQITIEGDMASDFQNPGSVTAPISQVRWLDDSRQIVFLGKGPSANRGIIYIMEIPSGEVKKLCENLSDVRSFDYRDGTLIYKERVLLPIPVLPYPVVPASRTADGFAYQGNGVFGWTWTPSQTEMVIKPAHGGVLREIDRMESIAQYKVAPGGKWAIVWSFQKPEEPAKPALLECATGTRLMMPMRAGPRDVPGVTTSLAPFELIFAANGEHVLCVNAISELAESDGSPAIIDYNVKTGELQRILDMAIRDDPKAGCGSVVTAVREMVPGAKIEISLASPRDITNIVYKWSGDSWMRMADNSDERRSTAGSYDDRIKIYTREGINEPPVVMATNGRSEIRLTGEDNALKGVRLSAAAPLVFQLTDGRSETAHYIAPVIANSSPVPLVILVDGDGSEKRFMPDGGVSGFAAQTLVARGVGVLLLPRQEALYQPIGPIHQEMALFRDRLKRSVEELCKRVAIDPKRIGIAGFSRTGFHVIYSIAHPTEIAIAAAVALDSFTGSYTTYLNAAAAGAPEGFIDRSWSGNFWRSKATWLDEETTFNVDRIRTPLLYTSHGGQLSVAKGGAADLLGAFRMSHRPIEFLWFPAAAHRLERPRQRFEAMNAVVEWFAFWLKDERPSDPARTARWAILRKQQDEVLKTPPPPKGKWVFQPDPVQPEWHPREGAKSAAEMHEKKLDPVPAGKS